jgi:hypothetical protein
VLAERGSPLLPQTWQRASNRPCNSVFSTSRPTNNDPFDRIKSEPNRARASTARYRRTGSLYPLTSTGANCS